MRTRRFSANHLLIAFAALLISSGTFAMFAEFRPYVTANAPIADRVRDLAAGDTSYGLSTSSRQVLLFDCRTAIVSLYARVQTAAVRDGLHENCLAASDRLVAEQPTFSIAWLTGALAASQLGDWDGFNRRFEQSWRTGPVEQWIAQIRVSIAESYYDRLSEAAKAGNAADMLLMTDTDPGLLELARIYVRLEASRGRITAVIAQTPEVTREKFERRVRMVTEGAGS